MMSYKIIKGKELQYVTLYPYKNNRKPKQEESYDNIFCFDIETSSGFIHKDSNIVEPFLNKGTKYYRECEKVSLCYIWQFSIDDQFLCIGRTLEDFKDFLDELEEYAPKRKFIYVHNLSFEFQFLLNVIKFDKVFAREKRKVIFANYGTYTFRCSYTLVNLSLDTWAKEKKLDIKKLTGNLDYNKLRTPKTELTQEELDYCTHDVLVMYSGLKEYKEKYKHIIEIPLTQTGEVRRECIKIFKDEYKYRKKCINLIPKTIEDYKRLISAFVGGYTHSNYIYTDMILNDIYSYDIASSYPTVMLLEKYPMTQFLKVDYSEKYLNSNKYSFLIEFEVEKVESVLFNSFLSKSKMIDFKKCSVDNGRIIKADYLRMILTNIDYDIFKKCYKYEKLNIIDFRVSYNEYLPKCFINYILELYGNKTTLKGVEDSEALYMKSKQYINSLYGMNVTKDITDIIEFNGEEWTKTLLNEDIFKDRTEHIKKNQKKVFTAFQIGVWVTAYARRNLWNAIIELDNDVVYCDTDSVKLTEPHNDFFEKYNNNIKEREDKRATELNINEKLFHPKDKNGNEYRIGIFCFEEKYDKFKTLGAKKYIYEKDNELHMTVSGVRKKAVTQLKSIEDFNINTVFDIEHAKKNILTYREDMTSVKWNVGEYDEYISNYKYGISFTPTTYELGMSLDYISLIYNNKREETEIFKNEQAKIL